jgi:nitroreductase
MRASIRAFYLVARRRRSVREFSPEDVPDDVIEMAVRCAATAPSGANFQPWKFVIVRDPAIKKKIREAAEAEEKLNYSGRMPDEWLRALAPLETDWRKEFLEIAHVLIVVFREDYHFEGEQRVQHYYVPESVGLAAGLLLASLNAAGLVTLTHTPSPMGFLREILDRPVNGGHRSEDPQKGPRRDTRPEMSRASRSTARPSFTRRSSDASSEDRILGLVSELPLVGETGEMHWNGVLHLNRDEAAPACDPDILLSHRKPQLGSLVSESLPDSFRVHLSPGTRLVENSVPKLC